VMRCCGRQCRGQGRVFVKLVRQTEQKLLQLGEPMTALGQHAQHLLDQATTLSDAQRKRITAAFTAALSSHAHIRKQSTRLTHGQKLLHCKLVNAYDLTIAPILKGKSNCPAQFGRKPGIASDPATGFIFANRVPAGNPSDPSYVLPLLAKVQRAIAPVETPQRLRVQSVAGDLGIHDEALRQALHARGILTVGIPKTIEPIKADPSPKEIHDILEAAGLHRIRTPHQVQLACTTGYSRPVVESHIASLLARGAGQVRYKGLEGAMLQQGMTVLAYNGAVVVRIRRQQLSKRAQKFRRLLGLKPPKVNELNRPKN
jgi:Transposase DDE domain